MDSPQPKTFLATLNFWRGSENGGTDEYRLGTGNDTNVNTYFQADVLMTDVRGHEHEFKLDKHGFQFVKHRSNFGRNGEWRDRDKLNEVYYAELRDLIKKHTGATTVIPRGRVVRDEKLATGDPISGERKRIGPYATLAHVDFSYTGARQYIEAWGPEAVAKAMKCRWAIIATWRPIIKTATRMPLGICDASSIGDEDLREVMGMTKGRGQSGRPPAYMWMMEKPRSPDQHRWLYMSDMKPEDAVLMKFFDTREDVARRTPHSAFETPFDHGPERSSLEVRSLVLWED
ncbi:hypothetical protein COCCADRAFT_77216, partial [Bipolaris zeicola 26-R-13]